MEPPLTRNWFLADESATLSLAEQLTCRLWRQGGIIYLTGPLGAGKTTFVRGVLAALGHRGPVRSPTYTLVEPYTELALPVYHFDCYRFADPEEFYWGGFIDYFEPNTLCLVEWPEKAAPYLPAPDWTVALTILSSDSRQLSVTAHRSTLAPFLALLS